MDTDPKQRRKMNPRFKANLFSALTFGWTLETFILGYSRDIKEEDLYAPLPEHRSDVLGDALENTWKEEVERESGHNHISINKKPSLRKVLCKVFGAELMLYGLILAAMEFIIRLQQPLFLGLLLRYYSPTQELYNRTITPSYLKRLYTFYDESQDTSPISWGEAIFFSLGVVFCSMVNVMVQHPFMMGAMHLGMKMRVAICSLIYRKTLRVNLRAMSETGGGSVVNLLGNDVNRFDTGPLFIHYLWIGPVETLIVTFYIYRELGMPAVYGVCMILIVMPFQTYLGFKTAYFRRETAKKSDKRVRLMEEIIMGIEVIKMYTWEQPFRKIIDSVRREEIRYIKLTSYIRGIVMSFIMFTSRFSIFVTVLLYVMYVQRITVESVFFLTCFYNIIKQTMTLYFPQAVGQTRPATWIIVSNIFYVLIYIFNSGSRQQHFRKRCWVTMNSDKIAELDVAIQRIRDFLISEECLIPYRKDPTIPLTKSKARRTKKRVTISEPRLEKTTQKASTSKSKTIEDAEQKHIAIKFENACSRWLKSSLKDDVADVTINVFRKSLTTVIGAVGSGKSTLLHMVLNELPCLKGNMEVSGTVSYASQDPWLFVGSVRQNILFGKPFDKPRYMEVCKVCALERDISMFPHGDKTIIGERGVSLSGGQRARINLARAVYKEADIYLLDDPLSAVDTQVARHIFENCIKKYLKDKTVVLVTHQLQFIKSVDQIIIFNNGKVLAQGKFDELDSKELAIIQSIKHRPQEQRTEEVAGSLSKITLAQSTSVWSRWSLMFDIQDQKERGESQTEGRVDGFVYKKYFLADSTCCYVLFVMFTFLLAQFFASASDYWISRWSIAEDHVTGDATLDYILWSQYGLSRDYFALIFGILTVATVAVALIRAFFFFSLCMKSSIMLHDNMFDCVSNAPMSFFHSNPSGRILNRFSKDMGAVDEYLPQAMLDCVQIILNLFGVIMVILVTEVLFLVPIAATLLIFYAFRLVYIRTSSAIKRLEGITKSPVFGHVNATLLGLPTIRSFEAEILLVKEFDRHQDLHSAAWYLFITTSRAFGYFLDVVCLLFIFCVTFTYIMKTDIEGSCAGLVITQSISLTGVFQWGMRQSAEMENQMTSVERVLEYTRIPRETTLTTKPEIEAPENWPSEGAIVFENLSLKYAPDGNEVLHKLNLNILPQEKIGIVGRTGAGKSSIIQALFRLAYLEGTIFIDDVDITTIRLEDLRKKISIIPQEPVLFSGTMRKNLDPFDQYSDEVLLSALEKVELLDEQNPEDALYKKVSECGSNFSVGERQLVCLARAIVNNARILLLDEATANVDAQTDALIQTAIRQHFWTCTVLTVAHRLNTVIDSDKILVLDGGHLMEYEHPYVLLQNRHGHFRKMVAETGPAMAQTLQNMAAENYKKINIQN